jgi:hypothetical protein
MNRLMKFDDRVPFGRLAIGVEALAECRARNRLKARLLACYYRT